MWSYKDTSATVWVFDEEKHLFEGTNSRGRVAYISPKVLRQGVEAKKFSNQPLIETEKAFIKYLNENDIPDVRGE